MRPSLRPWLKRLAIALLVVALAVLAAAAAGGLWLRGRLRASLPRLDGEVELAGLQAAVLVERDDLGVPTAHGVSRVDVARATGFLHGQERFFQMDLQRRSAAGELAALVGPAVLPFDRRARVHRFRAIARRDFELAAPDNRVLLEAYAAGVNAGLAALGAPPPEYLALRAGPEPWTPEDTQLVVLAMYLDLQGDDGLRESGVGLLHDLLPPDLARLLVPRGTEWDAPLVGGAFATPPLPGPESFDLRRGVNGDAGATPGGATRADTSAEPAVHADAVPPTGGDEPVEPTHGDESPPPGSNSWAVAGDHAADGGALLANDMHLGLRLPNIWYRACFHFDPSAEVGVHTAPRGADAADEVLRVCGVTLPGAPPIIAGSNGHVAWGFTNSQGDWSDLVVLEIDPHDPDVYRTPDGPRRFERFEERIQVKGAEDVALDVRWTIWGPVIDRDHRGRPRALRWIAHDPAAVDLGLVRMERARDLDEALLVAAGTRIPTQNCVVADGAGRIGWTLMGPIPRRFGHDGQLPRSWAAGDAGWDGLLGPEEVPRIVDPPSGRIWTANNRVVDGEPLRAIGDGGFALGARAAQIRDGLAALTRATPRDLLAIQLDDRALFLARWRDLLLAALTDDAVAGRPHRAELRRLVAESWTGRASIDSAAYRMVRAFRLTLAEDALGAITRSCTAADERFSILSLGQWEGALWRLVTERPAHLLDPRHASWDEALLAAADRMLDGLRQGADQPLAALTWGARNTVRIQHPLALAVPPLARWLDIPAEPLPGDAAMPRVQAPGFGASQRFVVSPGREEAGIFHMPGGQSGHFLSPYYRKGHGAWSRGEPTPFLPGATVHRLTLAPPGSQLARSPGASAAASARRRVASSIRPRPVPGRSGSGDPREHAKRLGVVAHAAPRSSRPTKPSGPSAKRRGVVAQATPERRPREEAAGFGEGSRERHAERRGSRGGG